MWKIKSTKRLARRGYSLEELLKGTQLFVLNMKIDTTRPSYFQTMVSQLASLDVEDGTTWDLYESIEVAACSQNHADRRAGTLLN